MENDRRGGELVTEGIPQGVFSLGGTLRDLMSNDTSCGAGGDRKDRSNRQKHKNELKNEGRHSHELKKLVLSGIATASLRAFWREFKA